MHLTVNNSEDLTRSVHIPTLFAGGKHRDQWRRLVGQTPLLEFDVHVTMHRDTFLICME